MKSVPGRRRTKAKSVKTRRTSAAQRKSEKPRTIVIEQLIIQIQQPAPVKPSFWQKWQPQLLVAGFFVALAQLLIGDGILRQPIEQRSSSLASSRVSTPKVEITSPHEGSVYVVGSPVTLAAVANTPAANKLQRVRFSANGRPIENVELYQISLTSLGTR